MARLFLSLTTSTPPDRTGRRKEQITWPQVDERRESEGRRFSDTQPESLEALAYAVRVDPENQPFNPCKWGDV